MEEHNPKQPKYMYLQLWCILSDWPFLCVLLVTAPSEPHNLWKNTILSSQSICTYSCGAFSLTDPFFVFFLLLPPKQPAFSPPAAHQQNKWQQIKHGHIFSSRRKTKQELVYSYTLTALFCWLIKQCLWNVAASTFHTHTHTHTNVQTHTQSQHPCRVHIPSRITK